MGFEHVEVDVAVFCSLVGVGVMDFLECRIDLWIGLVDGWVCRCMNA